MTYSVPNFVLKSREDAEKVVTAMNRVLENFGVASVGDLLDLVGLSDIKTHVEDLQWGWINIQETKIKEIDEGFVIEFPPVRSLQELLRP